MVSLKADEKIYYGWWIVAACSFLTFYGAGTFFYGFTVFVHPMIEDLGWGMALISGAFSLYRLESGVAAPLAGFLIDRMGPRYLVMAGGLIWGSGFIYLSHITSVFHFYLSFFVISFGWTFASGTTVPSAMIAKWFIRKRGRAIGIFVAASGLSGMLVPVLSYMITHYGWQRTLLMIGILTWLVVTPISITLRSKPEDYGLYPDGKPPEQTPEVLKNNGATEYGEVNFSIKKALCTPAFLLLSLTFWSFQVTMSSVFVHLVPHLITAGIGEKAASMAVMFTTLCSVLGRAGYGWLSDSLNKKKLFISTFVLQAIGLFAFSRVSKIIHLIPFLVAYAPGYGGSVALRAPIVGEYYGRKNFGTLYGVLIGIAMFGGIIGPIVAGFAYDYFGNFRGVFTFFSLINFFSALVLFFLKRPRPVS